MRGLAPLGVVAGEPAAASLAGRGRSSPTPTRRGSTCAVARALVLCTEGATDPVAYREIVGRDPESVA